MLGGVRLKDIDALRLTVAWAMCFALRETKPEVDAFLAKDSMEPRAPPATMKPDDFLRKLEMGEWG